MSDTKDLKLSEVMSYIRGEEVSDEKLLHYQSLLSNFRPNFLGFMAMTTYKQMERLSRLLDRLDEIEEYLFMDRDSVFYTQRYGNTVQGATSKGDAIRKEREEDLDLGGSKVSGVSGGGTYSERSERELLAAAERISQRVQETLSYLVTLLDKIQKKSLPEDVDNMLRSQKVLPESGTASKILDKSSRDNVRKLITTLQTRMKEEEQMK